MSLHRRGFLAAGATTAGAAAYGTGTASASPSEAPSGTATDTAFLALLTRAADARVPGIREAYPAQIADLRAAGKARAAARSLRTLTSVYAYEDADHHHDTALLSPMRELATALAQTQYEDGLWDQGAVHSPPDSAFSLVDLACAYRLLREDGHPATESVRRTLAGVLRKAVPGLADGGVHTPNHRWKVCAALARIHRLWPDARCARRIDAWLAEGIDQLPGGEYSERSPTYAAVVTNPSLLTLARLYGRTDLYGHVRRNLTAALRNTEENGEVETIHSRRQDQTQRRRLPEYWLQFREVALRDGDGRFAAVARRLQERGEDQEFGETPLGDRLAEVLEHPYLARPLPEAAEFPDDFVHHDRASGLVRIRRGARSASVFGGTDFPDVHAIASGLSTNPTFFKLRKGAAVLESVRLAPQFFSTGHFRAASLEPAGDGWRLSGEVRAAFHQPLPPQHRRPDGAYPLTDDGRFWSSMDFPHRPKQWRTLRTEVLVRERGGGFDLEFTVRGAEVPLALELCFRHGGRLTGDGLAPVPGDEDARQLVRGQATYTAGGDRIVFGPGNGKGPRQPPVVDAGERYTWMNGSLTPDGTRVLITGRAPFAYTLRLR